MDEAATLMFRSGDEVACSVRGGQGSVYGVPPRITKAPQPIRALRPPAIGFFTFRK